MNEITRYSACRVTRVRLGSDKIKPISGTCMRAEAMSKRVSLAEANGNLAELIQLAQSGEEVVIEDGDKNQVKLVTLPRTSKPRTLGLHEGQAEMHHDFDVALPKSFWLGGTQ